ncbi:acyl-CoA reductase [Blastococcus sp. Marseille-P5729]|uniref:acyl-CoA reductase n=1 Tax=Blastococcus sp. Marseille-P5729 TaxID=2086582 RepID=UPI00131DF3D5|nr:acyl-CoA reductase [Blastococcus sp. Marseille-P5729]
MVAAISSARTLPPFGDEVIDFGAALSRRLSKIGRGMPETEALAFWMRKAELRRLADSFAALGTETELLMPRGTVFHVPPANVDTLFVYSWLLATLTGNRNIVRMSERSTEQAATIVGAIRDVVGDFPAVAATSTMVTYGHEQEITDALSAACDVRVIWGGDGTVDAIRRSPLPPHAKELTFPDRFSLGAIKTTAYEALGAAERDRLCTLLFNDAYWFDQLGCSSPRLVVWVGQRDDVEECARDLMSRLRASIDAKGYSVDTATAVAKILQSYRTMIDADVSALRREGNELVMLTVESFPQVRGEFCGGGLFYSLSLDTLLELAPHIERRDQTLAYHGFEPSELRELAVALNGRGIDRMVPFGKALAFNRLWDGYDLLQEFTRRVTIDIDPAL